VQCAASEAARGRAAEHCLLVAGCYCSTSPQCPQVAGVGAGPHHARRKAQGSRACGQNAYLAVCERVLRGGQTLSHVIAHVTFCVPRKGGTPERVGMASNLAASGGRGDGDSPAPRSTGPSSFGGLDARASSVSAQCAPSPLPAASDTCDRGATESEWAEWQVRLAHPSYEVGCLPGGGGECWPGARTVHYLAALSCFREQQLGRLRGGPARRSIPLTFPPGGGRTPHQPRNVVPHATSRDPSPQQRHPSVLDCWPQFEASLDAKAVALFSDYDGAHDAALRSTCPALGH